VSNKFVEAVALSTGFRFFGVLITIFSGLLLEPVFFLKVGWTGFLNLILLALALLVVSGISSPKISASSMGLKRRSSIGVIISKYSSSISPITLLGSASTSFPQRYLVSA